VRAFLIINSMANKDLIQPLKIMVKHDCLDCLNGTIGAYNLIYCTNRITPQPNRMRWCNDYKKRETN
jgi:hypothetical protein